MTHSRRARRSDRPMYKNVAEQACSQLISSHGLEFSKRGWPDFFVWHPNGGLAVVEVKRAGTHKLKKEQQHVMECLASCGIACYRWDPERGFQRIYTSRTDNPIQPIHLQIGETQHTPSVATPTKAAAPSWYNPIHLLHKNE